MYQMLYSDVNRKKKRELKTMTSKPNINQYPIPSRCYEVYPSRLLVGKYPYNPGADEPFLLLDRIVELGYNSFVDLTEEDELTHYDGFLAKRYERGIRYKRFEIEDYSVPTISDMQETTQHIISELEKGKNLYIHCRGGIGRSCLVLACFLSEKFKDPDKAVAETENYFSASSAAKISKCFSTEEQLEFVYKYFQQREIPKEE